jgi:hypothetical protein
VPIRDLVTRLDTGRAERGEDMKLMEMFSAIGAPKEEDQDIDWLDDLKFYIDNKDDLLEQYIFPTLEKHKRFVDHPDAYKLYINPIKQCCEKYCEEFDIEEKEEKFGKEQLIELAKKFAEEQKKHIEDGDYDK